MEVEPIRKMSDVKRMYNHLLRKGINREAECFLIGCNVALRAGDLLTIRFDQIERGQKKVIINEQKTGKKREFPITSVVRESVARLRVYYETPRSHGNKHIDPVYLFQSTSHRAANLCQPICIQWLGQAIKKASRELDLGYNVNTHSMRKTWGYHAYEGGANIHYIQALLNHRDQHVTLRYIGITKTAIEQLYIDNTLEIAS